MLVRKTKQLRVPDSNYYSEFINGNTNRYHLDDDKPVLPLPVDKLEYADIAINSKCVGVDCPYCYTDATKHGSNFQNVPYKVKKLFELHQPYQVAIGGAGEPLIHPELKDILESFRYMGIVPNVTTSGISLNEEKAKLLEKHCGGISVTVHRHKNHWGNFAQLLGKKFTVLNFHYIFGYYHDDFQFIMENLVPTLKSTQMTLTLLPFMQIGRGGSAGVPSYNEESLVKLLVELDKNKLLHKVSYGSRLVDFLKKYNLPVDFYDEGFGAYIMMDSPIRIYGNSFEMKLLKTVHIDTPPT